ncbi:hypothetical protein [Methanoregula sp.]|uniref:hypothetical protein n=1 Tax=Methanoregula sp. TaxID=2052170 RepID=UPI003BD803BB
MGGGRAVYIVWADEGCIATEPMREFPTPSGSLGRLVGASLGEGGVPAFSIVSRRGGAPSGAAAGIAITLIKRSH